MRAAPAALWCGRQVSRNSSREVIHHRPIKREVRCAESRVGISREEQLLKSIQIPLALCYYREIRSEEDRGRKLKMAVMRSSSLSASDDVVIKSPMDKRLYRILYLPNGLCALLVHDPEIFPDGPPDYSSKTLENGDEEEYEDMSESEGEYDEDEEDDDEDEEEEEEEDEDDEEDEGKEVDEKKKNDSQTKKAAAAMCVGMGSFSDPFEAQEHMLFMGSTEFPDENEYDSYLSKHGGSSNAYTETEFTCYHFEVKREFLKGALKRFSQFFISPLVKAEAMERELLAVDSEFNQVLQSDACRLQQLQCHTSPPSHPFNRFFWGNKKSLADAMEKGIDLREKILQLYRENYHGGLMKLVVIGGEPLDILENWVVELFGSAKEGPQFKSEDRKVAPIWKAGKLYRLDAVKDVHVLNLTWTLPCLHKEYLKKPEDCLAHLMGHEGSGSLHYFLKTKGWATSVSAGVGDEGMQRSSIAYIFGISIHLTDSGLEKVYEVIGVVYQYVKLLRQSVPQEWIFKELQDIGNMEFRFSEEQPQDDYAAELAENLLVYPEKHVIYGDYAFEVWDEKLLKHVLSFFTPENMRVDILSKFPDKQSQDFQFEPWFGSRYTEEDISPFLALWSDPPEIDSFLHLPLKNEFIPSDFSIRSNDSSDNHVNVSLPRCILDLPLMKFWYKLDRTFKLPRANTYFLITVKGGYNNVESCVLTELFVSLLKDELNEILYQAGVAKLETSLSIIGDKLELKVYGFNDKLPVLLSKILTVAKSFRPTYDRFVVIKEAMERALRNTNMKPLAHSSYLRLQVLRKKFWDVDDKLACLGDISVADLEGFIPELLSQLHVEGLCHGNLSEEEAINILNIFRDNFAVQPLPMEVRHEERIIHLSSGANLVRDVCVKNKLEMNSVVELYFQIEQDIGEESTKLRALADLFDDIIEEPLFNQLRTKEQLGYVVECSPRMTFRVLGFCFCVQSSKYDPVYLQGRIDNFISGLQELLVGLDDESFENYRSGLIAKKLEKDPSLTYKTNHLWGQIVDKRYLFDMSQKEAEELRGISKNDVIYWFNTYLRPSSPKCRRLAVHLWGCNTNMKVDETQVKSVTMIEDVGAFKMSADFYPSLC
ncbi:nardilysin-like isoform X2 [Macadamia integrifolia]|uniref:nardilysin-like isoform X2 n=1 Tax=Macadamia integrifolia TaxID=60698 RepID=UPI001C4F78F9|nr:nardilysin-like isoform X2 [Macadamia integrifolia]